MRSGYISGAIEIGFLEAIDQGHYLLRKGTTLLTTVLMYLVEIAGLPKRVLTYHSLNNTNSTDKVSVLIMK